MAESPLFHALYASLGINVIETVAEGDCGLDVACMMLRQPRGRLRRNTLRCELCAFALEHVGNRALVACLHGLGEFKANLGFFDLESSAELLLARLHHGSGENAFVAEAGHHGDGDAVVPAAPAPETDHTGAVIVSEASKDNEKRFFEEEIEAIKWKCQLQKSSSEFVHALLRKLPKSKR